jgi:hypothetical protein
MPRSRLALRLCLCLLAAPAAAQDAREVALAREILAGAQAPSFQRNREYCGTIGADRNGRLLHSEPRRGGRDSCTPRDHPDAWDVFASFHTHGGFDPEADSEVPSVYDVQSDMAEGLDGYVATPGGRLWFIDGQTGVVRQICGLGCLPADPDFVPGLFGPIATRYTLSELDRRERTLD